MAFTNRQRIWLSMFLGVAAGLAPRVYAQQVQLPQVISRAVIFTHPSSDPYARNNYRGFNHAPSIVALPDGRLLTAWFSAPFEASVDQLILGSYSSDGGKTWGKPVVLEDYPHLSDFDPAFIADGKKTLLFFSVGRENRYPPVHDEKNNIGVSSFRTYVRNSSDSGHTWSTPRVVGERMFCRSNGVRLSNGDLLLPMYEIPSRASVLRSTDDGMTWQQSETIATSAGAGEPSIAELKPGVVMMVLRTSDGFLWTVRSNDSGKTWSVPVKTSIAAATTSHNIFRLDDGRLLLTLNESAPNIRTPLVMHISSDEGATWSTSVSLAKVAIPKTGEDVWAREVSYPSVAQLKDGTVVAVWTKLSFSDAQQYGDIEAARLRIP